MSVDTELASIVTRARLEAGKRFDAAQAARYPADPEFRVVPYWETLGRIARQFNDALAEMARQFDRGYRRG